MSTGLEAKVEQYESLLSDAVGDVEAVAPAETPLAAVAADYREMAEAYLADGRHFREDGDFVNALAAFAYGHAWLDAGARLGVFSVPAGTDRFTV